MSPPDDDEIPPTEPAPAATPTERVPSLTSEDFDRSEAVTAVRCPHPPGLDGQGTGRHDPEMSETRPRTLHLLQDATIASWALEQYDRIELNGHRLTVQGDIEDAVELARKTGQLDEAPVAR